MEYSQETMERVTNDDLELVACPECGRDDFDSSQGVAMHFSYNHEGSLSYLFRCEECGKIDAGTNSDVKFCSKDCETLNRVGTLKHQDEDFLRDKIENEGMRAVEVAEELGVNPDSVHKWVEKYEIGNDYDCPSCPKSFASKQGVSKHHTDEHGESISGTEYECEYCGETNWTPRCNTDDWRFPKYCDDDCFGADMEGEDNPNKDPERQDKISKGLLRAYSEGRRKPGHKIQQKVEETGNIVDSSWEAEVDRILHGLDVEYHYNGHGEYKRYDFGDFTHAPDFIIPVNGEDIVIEVKGGSVVFFQGDKMQKIGTEMKQREDVTYIVYGDVDLECDKSIDYGNEEELVSTVRNFYRE